VMRAAASDVRLRKGTGPGRDSDRRAARRPSSESRTPESGPPWNTSSGVADRTPGPNTDVLTRTESWPMKLVASLIIGSCLALPAAAPAQAPPAAAQLPSVTLPAALDRVLRDYERHWQARNADSLAALFTGDGFVLQSGRMPVRGLQGITAAYRGSGGPLALRALAFATADTVGYIIGAFASRSGDPDSGKFILALRRRPGEPWRIAADMDNGNRR
jgi:hypothetical protein